MPGYGYRLDTKPYVGGALQAKLLLEELPLRKDSLTSVTVGIFHAGRESRKWVETAEFGIPFLGSSALQNADFSNLPFISKEQVAHNPAFLLKEGYTLITRSGTIGKMAYCRKEMAGLACSEHVLRVAPDTSKIPPGYLYAFLSSKFGVPLVTSGTYGSLIQSIEPEHLAQIEVPRLDPEKEQAIHDLVEEAGRLRSEASAKISEAVTLLEKEAGFDEPSDRPNRLGAAAIESSEIFDSCARIDAWFFNSRSISIKHIIDNHPWGAKPLESVANVYGTPVFKRIYVDGDEHGVGFFGSAEIFKVDRTPEAFLSLKVKGIYKYILSEGSVIMASSGSLGGVIGRPQYVDRQIAGMAASNHVLRIDPLKDRVRPGYLYAYLASQRIGYPLILRTACGDAIPEIWPIYLNQIPVLMSPKILEDQIADDVENAFEMRVAATETERSAISTIEHELTTR